MNRCSICLLLVLVAFACRSRDSLSGKSPSVPADWVAWQTKRTESVNGTNGWTTLVGLHWLQEGRNSAGSNPTNHVVLPQRRAPESIGTFIRTGSSVRFEVAQGVVVAINGNPVQVADLQTDLKNEPTRLQVGPLSIIVIERGERIGVRVRDPESPARVHFRGLEYFAYNPKWRIEGRFESFPARRTLRVHDVTGGRQELIWPGSLVFTWAGVEYRLDAVEEAGEDDYLVMFRDRATGETTYAAGRFLKISKPDANQRVVIDFNRAYNPPCAFTPFATCPLPPRQNTLPFAVPAGERKPAEIH